MAGDEIDQSGVGDSFMSLDLVKQHLNVMHSEDDTLINSMLAASIEHAESIMGKSISQTTSPNKVRAWIFMSVGEMYANRSLSTPVYMHSRPTAIGLLDSERDYSKVM